MSSVNPIVSRLTHHRDRIQGMLSPGRKLSGDITGASISPVPPDFAGRKFLLAARKMRSLESGQMATTLSQHALSFGSRILEKFQDLNKILHLNNRAMRDTSIWSNLETTLPGSQGVRQAPPVTSGILRQGSVIQKFNSTPSPGQSIEAFKAEIQSQGRLSKPKPEPKKQVIDRSSRLYSRVDEITHRSNLQSEETPEKTISGPEQEIPSKSVPDDTPVAGPPAIQRQVDENFKKTIPASSPNKIRTDDQESPKTEVVPASDEENQEINPRQTRASKAQEIPQLPLRSLKKVKPVQKQVEPRNITNEITSKTAPQKALRTKENKIKAVPLSRNSFSSGQPIPENLMDPRTDEPLPLPEQSSEMEPPLLQQISYRKQASGYAKILSPKTIGFKPEAALIKKMQSPLVIGMKNQPPDLVGMISSLSQSDSPEDQSLQMDLPGRSPLHQMPLQKPITMGIPTSFPQKRAIIEPSEKGNFERPSLSYAPATRNTQPVATVHRLWEEHQNRQPETGHGDQGQSNEKDETGSPEIDLRSLAEDVFPYVKRILEVEANRHNR